MSLPLSGSDAYHIYSTTGLTNKWKLMSAAIVDGIYPEACTIGFWPDECRGFAASHRLVKHAPGIVSSPSSRKSSLLGLHWSPLAGMTNPDKEEVGKDGEKAEKGSKGETATAGKAVEKPEEAVVSSYNYSKADGPTIWVEPLLPKGLPAGAKVQSLEYIAYGAHFFDQILMDISKAQDPESPNALIGLKKDAYVYENRDIHCEIDITIWRICMILAERNGLKGFRIFPTPHHSALNRQRYTFDLHCRMSQLEMVPPLQAGQRGFALVHEDEVRPYETVAFCPGCGKKLRKDTKKLCSSCRIAAYCSRECQKADWQLLHKAECKTLQELAAAQYCSFCKRSEKKEQA